jgi:hypothetical protein
MDQVSCQNLTIYVGSSPASIHNPLEILYRVEPIPKIPPNSKEFCEHCVMVNPTIKLEKTLLIPFVTGCAKETCNVDLVLTGKLETPREPYVIGSDEPISLEYEITNKLEPAFMPQITIQLSSGEITRHPINCKIQGDSARKLVCDLGRGSPLLRGQKEKLSLSLDTSDLKGKSLNITAIASSVDEEKDPGNNVIEMLLPLKKVSNVDIRGYVDS